MTKTGKVTAAPTSVLPNHHRHSSSTSQPQLLLSHKKASKKIFCLLVFSSPAAVLPTRQHESEPKCRQARGLETHLTLLLTPIHQPLHQLTPAKAGSFEIDTS
ncbi:uncharacterized protein DFL_009650 [Arthrobotrys flagrans]|uniref:Uncharacterized protein n=1 Tax=Arthrobotrys flagrans TaxID=97331 RepID=A0A436ZST9_ARTFL|nr:hypothetical protein DFL_009650 [Arthrobotrys flagrans]